MNIENYKRVVDCRDLIIDSGPGGRGTRCILTLECGHEVNRQRSATIPKKSHCAKCARTVRERLKSRPDEIWCERQPREQTDAVLIATERGLFAWCCTICEKWHVGSAPGSPEDQLSELVKEGKR